MCRMLGYLGDPVSLENLLIKPDNSLIHQTTNPQYLQNPNLAGFGLAVWNDMMADPLLPLCFHSTQVAVLDNNLRMLARKLRVPCLVAHLRGVPHNGTAIVNRQSLHPFAVEGSPLVLAHNGDLADFARMRFALVEHIKPEIGEKISALTDSAWLHALILSQFDDPAGPFDSDRIFAAIEAVFGLLRKIRKTHGIIQSSAVNLILSDGINMVATRYTFDFGCFESPPYQGGVEYLSQWFTMGREYEFADDEWKMTGGAGSATLIASEPLTRDISTWLEVPEYSALLVDGRPEAERRRIRYFNV